MTIYQINIPDMPDFDFWRVHARSALADNISPHQLLWTTKNHSSISDDLFAESYNHLKTNDSTILDFKVPKNFIVLARTVVLHADKTRSHDLLYRLLWRFKHEEKHILHLASDNDVITIRAMEKAVRRDAYKITAFLRFRETTETYNEQQHFVSWYESEHYSLPMKLDFFMKRFRNMRWSILTPYMAAHWDTDTLICNYEDVDRSIYPETDNIENYWLTYYASIFNPARVKKQAMLNQMPKKYWKNMPETKIINDLLQNADKRVRNMIGK